MRTSVPTMDKLFGALAIGMLGVGGRHLYLHWKNKGQRSLEEKKLEVWEGEGGAVPVAPDRTAAQVTPRKPASPSP